MDIVGGVKLKGGGEAKIVSGIDDHSRFIISAHVVERATARPTCDGLVKAMRAYGIPEQILTDNGKVFTGRFGPGTGEVLFDRICRENGIKHILTAPRSPTTTGKIERWHRTMRERFLTGKVFDTIEDAQAQLDAWVKTYNEDRPHQSIGNVPPSDASSCVRSPLRTRDRNRPLPIVTRPLRCRPGPHGGCHAKARCRLVLRHISLANPMLGLMLCWSWTANS
jgi:Integrase core domain